MSNDFYCGNNYYKLQGKTLGSRYQCFKRGIGVGLRSTEPVEDYEPIDRYKIWCGNGKMPRGYNRTGTRSECLRKGFGVGKKLR